MTVGVLLCLVKQNMAAFPGIDCALTALDSLEGVVTQSPVPLLVGRTSAGMPRSADRVLVSMTARSDGLLIDSLVIGGAHGVGHACEKQEGYCVDVEGSGDDVVVDHTGCVIVQRGAPWSATHVRKSNKWINEVIQSPSLPRQYFQLRAGRFQRCGHC